MKTVFLRVLEAEDKAAILLNAIRETETSLAGQRFEVDVASFAAFPRAPFAYWVSDRLRELFTKLPHFEAEGRCALGGLKTLNDERFVRAWWEVPNASQDSWPGLAKGGAFSPFYADVYLRVNWKTKGDEISWYGYQRRPREGFGAASRGVEAYFRSGLTWPRRTQIGLGLRAMAAGCIFADKGPAAFVEGDKPKDLLSLLTITTSRPFHYLVELQMCFGSYEVGVIQRTPVPDLTQKDRAELAILARRAWSLKRTLDTDNETSHAFVLPSPLLSRIMPDGFDPTAIEEEIAGIRRIIDDVAFLLYGLDLGDRVIIESWNRKAVGSASTIDIAQQISDDEDTDEDNPQYIVMDGAKALLSWAAGVAFGRFDIRLATRERLPPPEPEPFEPLPLKSHGMLPDDEPSFHVHPGILVEASGHPHDLSRLIEDVLARVDLTAPEDVRRWLQREFFPHHLKQYSKSRRKAPIYWPLSTASGGYTLWLYYPALTDQTLYIAANDFVTPKLEDTCRLAAALRTRTDRSRDEERQLEQLQDLEAELKELQDELLRLAPTWNPNHDDGVQITAAPLWRLFRHRPWQTVLKETWEKLEKGEYDWAHLAMAYWPNRVREKCRTDKSLAIAHDLEDLYEPLPEKPGARRRGRKRAVEAA
jgi:hypothetical protein